MTVTKLIKELRKCRGNDTILVRALINDREFNLTRILNLYAVHRAEGMFTDSAGIVTLYGENK